MPKHYQIQRIIAPKEGVPSSLYWRAKQDGTITTKEGALAQLAEGAVCSFDTYFNSFYAAYWANNTTVERVGLSVKLKGDVTIRLLWRLGKTTTELCKFVCSSGSLKLHEPIWPELEGKALLMQVQSGLIYVEITANRPSSISELVFVTDVEPVRDIKMSVGLCTFNRETDLAKTLDGLNSIKQHRQEIGEIFVVNHANSFTNPRLLAALDEPAIHSIRQKNLGGCGGFNRTMIESVSSDCDYTHHLIMDDDIMLDPDIIGRAIDFLSFRNSEFALGGHMLESNDPGVLHEAGAVLDPFWYVVSQGKYLDVTEADSLGKFSDQFEIDYNAWWFCVLPTNAIRKTGYSPPLFIHGDDIEYGLGMLKAGFPTVSPPGIAVWHESFAAKNHDWVEYYDLRNRLIMSVLHPQKCRQPDTIYLFGLFLYLLLTHRYRAAEMCFKAVADFLDGPVKLFQTGSDDMHQIIVQHARGKDRSELVEQPDIAFCDDAPLRNQQTSTFYFVKRYILSYFQILFLPVKVSRKIHRRDTVHPATVGNLAYFLMDDLNKTRFIKHSPDRWLLLFGTGKALGTAMRYAFGRISATRNWYKELPSFQTEDFWRTQFGDAENSNTQS